VVAILASCAVEPLPSTGHLEVFVDTDAPVPGDTDAPVPGDTDAPVPDSFARPLLDSARLEILDDEGRIVARRETALTRGRLLSGLSFTVVPGVRRLRLHATLWLASTGVTEPRAAESVVGWFRLPPSPGEGARRVTAFLPLSGFGTSLGSPEAPAEPEEGNVSSRVGTALLARPTPCRGAPRDGEVCVPGGAFHMGHPRLAALGFASAERRRLVVVRPFFVDAHEVTVAAYRRDGRVFASRWSGRYTGSDPKDHCTFTERPGPHEDLPINCVRWEPARAFCKERGGDLPTEAQFEWLATGLGRALYPWGDAEPTCDDLVFGRGGGSEVPDLRGQPRTCAPATATPRDLIGGVDPVTAPLRRDAVRLGDRAVRDLVGNLREWLRDVYATQDSPCWAPRAPNVFVDPLCEATDIPPDADGLPRAARGAAFFQPAWLAPSAAKGGEYEGARLDIGFRCVRESP
jgi:formylglycine-generating enzyme required for sulfatase activity